MRILVVSLFAALALGVGSALAGTHHHAVTTLKVVMHDPGCHAFHVNGKYLTSETVNGPVRVENLDVNTLHVASRMKGMEFIPVGKSLVLERGNYVVMMKDQAPDDNYLKLTVK